MNIRRIKLSGILLVLLVLLHAGSSDAQNFKQVITNLREGYGKMERLHAVMMIQAFQDSLSTKPYYTDKADIKRDGKSYLYQVANMEMLLNATYMVVVDKGSKEIVCSKRNVKGEDDFFGKDPIKMNLDSMLTTLRGEPHFMGRSEDVETHRIFQKEGIITRIDMKINTRENVIVHLTYLYKDGQYVKIDFEVFDKQPEFKPGTFDESAFMVVVKGKFKTSAAYQQYSILEVKN